jgi:hypothetical protein
LSRSEVVSQLIEGAAEALGGSKAFETQHRIIALFDPTVILLDPIIFVAAAPMFDLLPEHFREGAWRGTMPVGGHLCGTASGDGLRTPEEALGGRHVPVRTEHRVNQLPLFVNRSI